MNAGENPTALAHGYYWIRPRDDDPEDGDVVVAEWDGLNWFIPGVESPQETVPEILSARLEPPL